MGFFEESGVAVEQMGVSGENRWPVEILKDIKL